jgi:hypothetical protein
MPISSWLLRKQFRIGRSESLIRTSSIGKSKTQSLKTLPRESFSLTGTGESERLQGRLVSANFLYTFGIKPIRGRDFLAVALTLIIVALIACCIPACRATKVDPPAGVAREGLSWV